MKKTQNHGELSIGDLVTTSHIGYRPALVAATVPQTPFGGLWGDTQYKLLISDGNVLWVCNPRDVVVLSQVKP